ncbi:MAG: inositol-3-phosphate synthase, partial [Myxococcales bacterium]
MVGLVIVGLGDVGSAILAGIEAARAHLVHPWGSLVDAGGAGRRPEHAGSQPLRSFAPFANLSDLALGAFELKEDDAFRAALRAGRLSRSLVDELRPQLRQIRAMSGARQAPTRRHLADALAEDLRGFSAHH